MKTNTVVEPVAVVIEYFNALVACFTVLCLFLNRDFADVAVQISKNQLRSLFLSENHFFLENGDR